MMKSSGEHRRGRSMGSVVPTAAAIRAGEKEDDLALFHEMKRRENHNFLHPSPDDLDATLSSKFGGMGAPVKKPGSDLLTSESDKNDYDWLLTPPGTPLFPSLDQEAAALAVLSPALSNGSYSSASSATKSLKSSYSPVDAASKVGVRRNPSPRRTTSATMPTAATATPVAAVTAPNGISRSRSSPSSNPILTRPSTPTLGTRPSTPTSKSSSTPAVRASTPNLKLNVSHSSKSFSAATTPTGTRPSTPNLAPNRPSTPNSLRSSTPPVRPSTPGGRSSTPTSKPSTPTMRRSLSGGRNSFTSPTTTTSRGGPSPKRTNSTSRGSSPSAKRVSTSVITSVAGMPTEAPPNLRTTMSERPMSSGGRSNGSRIGSESNMNGLEDSAQSRRRPRSPSVARSFSSSSSQEQRTSSQTSRGSVISAFDDGLEVNRPSYIVGGGNHSSSVTSKWHSAAAHEELFVGGKGNAFAKRMAKPSMRDAASHGMGPGSPYARASDPLKRQDAYQSSPTTAYKNLHSGSPGISPFYSTRTNALLHRTASAMTSSVTTSSNASSEHGTTVAADTEGSERDEDDLLSWDSYGRRASTSPRMQHADILVLDKDDEKAGTLWQDALCDRSNSNDHSSSHSQGSQSTLDAEVPSFYDTDGVPSMEMLESMGLVSESQNLLKKSSTFGGRSSEKLANGSTQEGMLSHLRASDEAVYSTLERMRGRDFETDLLRRSRERSPRPAEQQKAPNSEIRAACLFVRDFKVGLSPPNSQQPSPVAKRASSPGAARNVEIDNVEMKLRSELSYDWDNSVELMTRPGISPKGGDPENGGKLSESPILTPRLRKPVVGTLEPTRLILEDSFVPPASPPAAAGSDYDPKVLDNFTTAPFSEHVSLTNGQGAGHTALPRGVDFNEPPIAMDHTALPKGVDFDGLPISMDHLALPKDLDFHELPISMNGTPAAAADIDDSAAPDAVMDESETGFALPREEPVTDSSIAPDYNPSIAITSEAALSADVKAANWDASPPFATAHMLELQASLSDDGVYAMDEDLPEVVHHPVSDAAGVQRGEEESKPPAYTEEDQSSNPMDVDEISKSVLEERDEGTNGELNAMESSEAGLHQNRIADEECRGQVLSLEGDKDGFSAGVLEVPLAEADKENNSADDEKYPFQKWTQPVPLSVGEKGLEGAQESVVSREAAENLTAPKDVDEMQVLEAGIEDNFAHDVTANDQKFALQNGMQPLSVEENGLEGAQEEFVISKEAVEILTVPEDVYEIQLPEIGTENISHALSNGDVEQRDADQHHGSSGETLMPNARLHGESVGPQEAAENLTAAEDVGEMQVSEIDTEKIPHGLSNGDFQQRDSEHHRGTSVENVVLSGRRDDESVVPQEAAETLTAAEDVGEMQLSEMETEKLPHALSNGNVEQRGSEHHDGNSVDDVVPGARRDDDSVVPQEAAEDLTAAEDVDEMEISETGTQKLPHALSNGDFEQRDCTHHHGTLEENVVAVSHRNDHLNDESVASQEAVENLATAEDVDEMDVAETGTQKLSNEVSNGEFEHRDSEHHHGSSVGDAVPNGRLDGEDSSRVVTDQKESPQEELALPANEAVTVTKEINSDVANVGSITDEKESPQKAHSHEETARIPHELAVEVAHTEEMDSSAEPPLPISYNAAVSDDPQKDASTGDSPRESTHAAEDDPMHVSTTSREPVERAGSPISGGHPADESSESRSLEFYDAVSVTAGEEEVSSEVDARPADEQSKKSLDDCSAMPVDQLNDDDVEDASREEWELLQKMLPPKRSQEVPTEKVHTEDAHMMDIRKEDVYSEIPLTQDVPEFEKEVGSERQALPNGGVSADLNRIGPISIPKSPALSYEKLTEVLDLPRKSEGTGEQQHSKPEIRSASTLCAALEEQIAGLIQKIDSAIDESSKPFNTSPQESSMAKDRRPIVPSEQIDRSGSSRQPQEEDLLDMLWAEDNGSSCSEGSRDRDFGNGLEGSRREPSGARSQREPSGARRLMDRGLSVPLLGQSSDTYGSVLRHSRSDLGVDKRMLEESSKRTPAIFLDRPDDVLLRRNTSLGSPQMSCGDANLRTFSARDSFPDAGDFHLENHRRAESSRITNSAGEDRVEAKECEDLSSSAHEFSIDSLTESSLSGDERDSDDMKTQERGLHLDEEPGQQSRYHLDGRPESSVGDRLSVPEAEPVSDDIYILGDRRQDGIVNLEHRVEEEEGSSNSEAARASVPCEDVSLHDHSGSEQDRDATPANDDKEKLEARDPVPEFVLDREAEESPQLLAPASSDDGRRGDTEMEEAEVPFDRTDTAKDHAAEKEVIDNSADERPKTVEEMKAVEASVESSARAPISKPPISDPLVGISEQNDAPEEAEESKSSVCLREDACQTVDVSIKRVQEESEATQSLDSGPSSESVERCLSHPGPEESQTIVETEDQRQAMDDVSDGRADSTSVSQAPHVLDRDPAAAPVHDADVESRREDSVMPMEEDLHSLASLRHPVAPPSNSESRDVKCESEERVVDFRRVQAVEEKRVLPEHVDNSAASALSGGSTEEDESRIEMWKEGQRKALIDGNKTTSTPEGGESTEMEEDKDSGAAEQAAHPSHMSSPIAAVKEVEVADDAVGPQVGKIVRENGTLETTPAPLPPEAEEREEVTRVSVWSELPAVDFSPSARNPSSASGLPAHQNDDVGGDGHHLGTRREEEEKAEGNHSVRRLPMSVRTISLSPPAKEAEAERRLEGPDSPPASAEAPSALGGMHTPPKTSSSWENVTVVSPDKLPWDGSSEGTPSTNRSSPASLSRSMTLAEATDTILYCSSLMHTIVYKAAALAIEKEENAAGLASPAPTTNGELPHYPSPGLSSAADVIDNREKTNEAAVGESPRESEKWEPSAQQGTPVTTTGQQPASVRRALSYMGRQAVPVTSPPTNNTTSMQIPPDQFIDKVKSPPDGGKVAAATAQGARSRKDDAALIPAGKVHKSRCGCSIM